jgi:hypothetical protein
VVVTVFGLKLGLNVIVWALAVLTLGYLLPFAIAFSRGHKDTFAILFVDLFLGWSVIGWVVALVWSVKSKR